MSGTFSQLLLVSHYGGPQSELIYHLARHLKETDHYKGFIKVVLPSQGRWMAQDIAHFDKSMTLDRPLRLNNVFRGVLNDDSSARKGTVLSIWLFEAYQPSDDEWHEVLSLVFAIINQGIALHFVYDPQITGLQGMMNAIKDSLERSSDSDVPFVFSQVSIGRHSLPLLRDPIYQLLKDTVAYVQDSPAPDVVDDIEEPTGISLEPRTEDEPPSPPESPPPTPLPPQPQPKATWDVKEPDDPYFSVPHEYMDTRNGFGNWKIVGSSVRGRGHAHDGKYREDSFAIDTVDCWNIIAVSDGAGSRKYSRIGSKFATGAAVRGIINFAKDNDLKNVHPDDMLSMMGEALYVGLEHAYHRLETYVDEEREIEVDFHDLGCTLLLSIYCEVAGRHFVGGFQVGDGLIMVANDSQNLDDFFELTEGDSADFGGGTTFLTSEPLESWLERDVVLHELDRRPWLLMSMTDGVADDMVPYDRNVPRFLLPGVERAGVLTFEDSLEEAARLLLIMINYEKKGSFDDRTLVVMFQHLPEGTAVALDTSTADTVRADVDDDLPPDTDLSGPPPPTHLPETPSSIE